MERKSIGTFIAALRRANGMTQKDLAEKLKVSDKAVSRWERDESLPDLLLLPVIADVFHVTADELLRGEKKVQTAAETLEKPRDTAAEAERLKKQTKRVLTAQLNRLRSSNCIAIYIGALGLIAAIVCNFGFSRGLIGFCIGVVCIAVAVLLSVLFCQNAWQAADDEAYDAISVLWYHQQVVRWAKMMTFILLGMLALCLPFGAIFFDYSRYLDVFIEKGAWLRRGGICLAAMETALSVVCYLLNRGILKSHKLAPDEETVQMHGWCVKILCGVMALTLLWRLMMPDIGEIAMTKGEKYDNVELFVTEMNRRWEEQREYGYIAEDGVAQIATEYIDENGNPLSKEEAEAIELNYIYDKDGNVMAAYHQPYDVMGVRIQHTADGKVDILVNTAGNFRLAEYERNRQINLISLIFTLEPLLALAAYAVLRPGKKENK